MPVRRFKISSLLLLAVLFCTSVSAQDIPMQLEQALTSGNVKTLSKQFDQRLEIVIDDVSNSYSQQQAQVVLNEFLSGIEVESYEVLHRGQTKNQSTYSVARLTTSAGTYRVYLYVKLINGEHSIQTIKFEKQAP